MQVEEAEVFVDQDALFARLGLPQSDKNVSQQLAVFMKAMRTYIDREEVRGSVWAQFNEFDSLHHMRSKLVRLEHMAAARSDGAIGSDRIDVLIDDALDLLNYTAFLIRHIYGWKPDQSGAET